MAFDSLKERMGGEDEAGEIGAVIAEVRRSVQDAVGADAVLQGHF
jgi:hypothetical protein